MWSFFAYAVKGLQFVVVDETKLTRENP